MMTSLKMLHGLLRMVNDGVLLVGRQIAWIAMALMVAVIVIQVFFRYVLNGALPWPEEAARALMIWMTAVIAPSAYRWGVFVSIDMIKDALPTVLRRMLELALLVMSAVVLGFLLWHATKHFNSGFIFKSSALKIPLAWIYLAMPVCWTLMLSVTAELVVGFFGRLVGEEEDFPRATPPAILGTE